MQSKHAHNQSLIRFQKLQQDLDPKNLNMVKTASDSYMYKEKQLMREIMISEAEHH